MMMMMGFLLLVVAFVLLFISTGMLKLNEFWYRKKGLPPGTMGWPFIGETMEFLKQGPSFIQNQRDRYGNVFKSHILGCPTVVCADRELNRWRLMNEAQGLLIPGYPQSMLNIMGRWNIASLAGPLHRAMRARMVGLVGAAAIRDRLISKVDEHMNSFSCCWDGRVIDIQEKTKEMWLISALKLIAGIETGPLSELLKSEVYKLLRGTISLPFSFPGTNYHHGFKARKKIIAIFEKIISERRKASICTPNDMLDSLLTVDSENEAKLSDEQIIDTIITLIYSGLETVSTTTMMAVKYLHDHQQVLEQLRKEHFKIRKNRFSKEKIDWDDYKSMEFTRAVICETLRLATVVNGVLRKTTQDMELKGFIIPKEWKIYVYTRELNYDPLLYDEPLAFNPWRWMNKNLESHQYFLAFGGGGRLCPGKELGIVQISIFLHYFVTRYRWEEVGGEKLLKFPRIEAPNGFHIRIWNF